MEPEMNEQMLDALATAAGWAAIGTIACIALGSFVWAHSV